MCLSQRRACPYKDYGCWCIVKWDKSGTESAEIAAKHRCMTKLSAY